MWWLTHEGARELALENEMLDQRAEQEYAMQEDQAVYDENKLLRKFLQTACYHLHMCNGVFVPGNDEANGKIANILGAIAAAGFYDQDKKDGE